MIRSSKDKDIVCRYRMCPHTSAVELDLYVMPKEIFPEELLEPLPGNAGIVQTEAPYRESGILTILAINRVIAGTGYRKLS